MVYVPSTANTGPTATVDVQNDENLHFFESFHVEKTFHFFMGTPPKFSVNVETSILSLERLDACLCTVFGLFSAKEERGGGKKDFMGTGFTLCYVSLPVNSLKK